MACQFLKPIELGSSLEGWTLQPRWEHFGDPLGPGDLFLTWDHRFGCTETEEQRNNLWVIVRAAQGNYEARRDAKAALAKAVDAWENEKDPENVVSLFLAALPKRPTVR